jgi:hypothetical protein
MNLTLKRREFITLLGAVRRHRPRDHPQARLHDEERPGCLRKLNGPASENHSPFGRFQSSP